MLVKNDWNHFVTAVHDDVVVVSSGLIAVVTAVSAVVVAVDFLS